MRRLRGVDLRSPARSTLGKIQEVVAQSCNECNGAATVWGMTTHTTPITFTIEPDFGTETDEFPAHGYVVACGDVVRYVGPSTAAFDGFQLACFDAATRAIARAVQS